MTGADIHLWLTVLDAIPQGERAGLVTLSQKAIGEVMGTVIRQRLEKSFARLVGYDVWIGKSVMPMVRGADWQRAKNGSVEWIVSLDHRVVKAVRDAVTDDTLVGIDAGQLRKLDSRYSTVAWLRLQSWKAGEYPPAEIAFGAHPSGTAYQMRVDRDGLGWLFGFDDFMHESEKKGSLCRRLHLCGKICS